MLFCLCLALLIILIFMIGKWRMFFYWFFRSIVINLVNPIRKRWMSLWLLFFLILPFRKRWMLLGCLFLINLIMISPLWKRWMLLLFLRFFILCFIGPYRQRWKFFFRFYFFLFRLWEIWKWWMLSVSFNFHGSDGINPFFNFYFMRFYSSLLYSTIRACSSCFTIRSNCYNSSITLSSDYGAIRLYNRSLFTIVTYNSSISISCNHASIRILYDYGTIFIGCEILFSTVRNLILFTILYASNSTILFNDSFASIWMTNFIGSLWIFSYLGSIIQSINYGSILNFCLRGSNLLCLTICLYYCCCAITFNIYSLALRSSYRKRSIISYSHTSSIICLHNRLCVLVCTGHLLLHL